MKRLEAYGYNTRKKDRELNPGPFNLLKFQATACCFKDYSSSRGAWFSRAFMLREIL